MSQLKNFKKNRNQTDAHSANVDDYADLDVGTEVASDTGSTGTTPENKPMKQAEVPLIDDSEEGSTEKKPSFVTKTVALLAGIFSFAKIRPFFGKGIQGVKTLFSKTGGAFKSLGSRIISLIPKKKEKAEDAELKELTANRTVEEQQPTAKTKAASTEEFEEFSQQGWSVKKQAIIGLAVIVLAVGGYYAYGFVQSLLSGNGTDEVALNGEGEALENDGTSGGNGGSGDFITSTPVIFEDDVPAGSAPQAPDFNPGGSMGFEIPQSFDDPPAAPTFTVPDPAPIPQPSPSSNQYANSMQNSASSNSNIGNTAQTQRNTQQGNTPTRVAINTQQGDLDGLEPNVDFDQHLVSVTPKRDRGNRETGQGGISTGINDQGALPVFDVPNANRNNPAASRSDVASNNTRSAQPGRREINWPEGPAPNIPDAERPIAATASPQNQFAPVGSLESEIIIPESNDNRPLGRINELASPPLAPSVLQPKYGDNENQVAGNQTATDSRFGANNSITPSPPSNSGLASYGNSQQNSSASFRAEISGPDVYTVLNGENYWTISEKHYKTGLYYKALAELNRSIVPYPNQLKSGTRIRIPDIAVLQSNYPALCPELTAEGTPNLRRGAKVFDGENERTSIINRLAERVAASERDNPTITPGAVYAVQEGDTIFRIAKAELDSLERWVEIYRLNSTTINNENFELRPGMRLSLPAIR